MREHSLTLLVGFLGVASSACGFLAEATRPKRDVISLQGGECVYPMSPAYALGFVGLALLLLAITLITRCCRCCCKRHDSVSSKKFVLGIICAVISWLIAFYSGLLFFLGLVAVQLGRRGKAPECYHYVLANNLFLQAAPKAMFATFFGLCSHSALYSGDKDPTGAASS